MEHLAQGITLVKNADTTQLIGGTAARLITIGVPRKSPEGKTLEHEDITLLPGWNSVKTALWNDAKKNNKTLSDYYLARGLIEERELTPEGIKELSEPEALRMVQETWSEELLVRMRAAEGRGSVLALINEQISRLQPSPDALAQKAKTEAAAAKAGKR
jgi:hypothetical protein